MEPNTNKWPDAPASSNLRAGNSYLSDTQFNSRTPPGHPEGYLEAFANLYKISL
jgi:hypothetical protein